MRKLVKLQTNGSLRILFEGAERWWALKSELVIPKESISNVSWHEEYHEFGSMWRVGGTGAPGVLYAGYFRENHEWQFMFIRRPRGIFRTKAYDVLVIETHDFRYTKIYLTVPKSEADHVLEWWRKVKRWR